MKIIINYDFIKELQNANKPFDPMKIVKNNIFTNYRLVLPLYITLDAIILARGDIQSLINNIGLQAFLLKVPDFLAAITIYKETGYDPYKIKAESKLLKLADEFNNINVTTDYDLLLQSVYYDHIVRINLDENKVPIITSKKYVLVPAHSYSGDIEEVSIEQEHIIGNKEYILSVGTPQKARRLVSIKSSI